MKEPRKHSSSVVKIALLGVLLITSIWGASWFFLSHFITDPVERGTFGDMFGAVNALFSSWAFIGVIIAIILQKQELEEQRAEIRGSKEAHQETAKALKAQLDALEFRNRVDSLKYIIGVFDEWIDSFDEHQRRYSKQKEYEELWEQKGKYMDLLAEAFRSQIATHNKANPADAENRAAD